MGMFKIPATFTLEDLRDYFRIANKDVPLDDTDPEEINANPLMAMLDGIVNGDFRARLPRWTTLTRPTLAPDGTTLLIGEQGINTVTGGIEIRTINGAGGYGWVTHLGRWHTGSEPTGVLPGSTGWDLDIPGKVEFNGSEWI
jgi:hypothetical protein